MVHCTGELLCKSCNSHVIGQPHVIQYIRILIHIHSIKNMYTVRIYTVYIRTCVQHTCTVYSVHTKCTYIHVYMFCVWNIYIHMCVCMYLNGPHCPLLSTLNNPADMMDVVGVGGINFEDSIARFSSRGMTTWVRPCN